MSGFYTLNEAIRNKDFSKASTLILKYLRAKIGSQVFLYPIPETVQSAGKKVIGIRYFIDNGGSPKSVRFNWGQSGLFNSQNCTSVDYWDGSRTPQPNPSTHIAFEDEHSLVKILPLVVDLFKGTIKTSGVYVNEQDINYFTPTFSFDSHIITEANVASGDLAKTVANTLHALEQGLSFSDQRAAGGNSKYGPRWYRIEQFIKVKHPDLFYKEGKKILIDKSKVKKISPDEVLKAIGGDGAVTYTISAGAKETPVVDGVDEADLDRMTYEEQLDALKTGMKLLMSNATNALFLGGRGGCLAGDESINIREISG